MANNYRTIQFELSTKAMKEVLGSTTKGYAKMRKFFTSINFEHRSGSVYRSTKPVTRTEARNLVEDFGKANPWAATVVKSFYLDCTMLTDTVKMAASGIIPQFDVSGTN